LILLLAPGQAAPTTVVAPTHEDEEHGYVSLRGGVVPGAPGLAAFRAGLVGYDGGVEVGMAAIQSAGLLSTTLIRGPEFEHGRHLRGTPYAGVVGLWSVQPDGPGPGGLLLEGWSLVGGYAVRADFGGWRIDAAVPAFTATLVEQDYEPWDLWVYNSEVQATWRLLSVGVVSGFPTTALRFGDGTWTAEVRHTGWPERGMSVSAGLSWQREADLRWMVPG
jgi:hypothetical protein